MREGQREKDRMRYKDGDRERECEREGEEKAYEKINTEMRKLN